MSNSRHDRPLLYFFFNDTATTEIYTLSLHDTLPISLTMQSSVCPTTDFGKEARNNTAQAQSKTDSLNRHSKSKHQAIASVDKLHLTTPGVVKNDHVIAKLTTPISEPTADKIGLKAPAASSAAMANSTTPRKYASPLSPNNDNHAINGLLLMN